MFDADMARTSGGRALSSAGEFEAAGSIGIPEADPVPASGGDFMLQGGFDPTTSPAPATGVDAVFLDGFE